MPPRKLKQPQTTLLSLPTELLSLIVQLSAPPPDWTLTRATHLATLSLVCRALRGPAQEELFRHLIIRSTEQAKTLVAALRSASGAGLAASVRTLRAQPPPEEATSLAKDISPERFRIYGLASLCQKMEEMWLVQVGPIDLEKVAAGPALVSLHASGCTFQADIVSQTRKIPTLALRHLSFAGCCISGIRPNSLPNLTACALRSSVSAYTEDTACFAVTFASRLTSLYLCPYTSWSLLSHALLFENLRHLNVDIHDFRSQPYAFIACLPAPSHIHTLRIQLADECDPFDEPRFSENVKTLFGPPHSHTLAPTLRHLRLPHSLQPHETVITRMVNEEPYHDVTVNFDALTTSTNSEDIGQGFFPLFWPAVDDVEAEEERGRAGPLEGM
ncbi:hypothetical protein RQP46_008727 [Phenoliferia psychrophenolica]